MIERDLSAIMRGVAPVLKEQIAAISARMLRENEQAEAVRNAEHRALMAEHRAWMIEQREAAAAVTRQIEERLASVKDGADGRDGADGAPGRDGVDGVDGKDGEPGATGRDGADGKDGAEGPAGPQGEPGANGADGRDGEPGTPGEQGLRGEAGADGKDGLNGTNGTDGQDAYPGEARGLFDASATYRALDVVSFNGCEWRARRDAPGELPGDGWMLSASRGKRGDRGERGKDGSTVVALYREPDGTHLVLTKDDGTELKADLADFLPRDFGGDA